MTLHLDAKRRDITRRLAICSEDEIDLIDLLLLHVERSRGARIDHGGPLFETGGDYTAEENAYRRGHNDAMRAESPQVTLWRGRLLLATRREDLERGLAELATRAPQPRRVRIECSTCHAEWSDGHNCATNPRTTVSGIVEFDLSDGGEP